MKCPDCRVELKCPSGVPALPEEAGLAWGVVEDGGVICCPVCKFSAHVDYWSARNSRDDSVYQNIPFKVKTHWLKISPPYFYAILTGHKTFEIRKDDRGFKVGHLVIFQMWELDKGLHNRSLPAKIVYVTDFPEGLKPGYVVLGIRRL